MWKDLSAPPVRRLTRAEGRRHGRLLAGEHGVPLMWATPAARRRMVRRWGLPNAQAPTGFSPWCRWAPLVWVDDEHDGRPVAIGVS